jgi:hypothetical protein
MTRLSTPKRERVARRIRTAILQGDHPRRRLGRRSLPLAGGNAAAAYPRLSPARGEADPRGVHRVTLSVYGVTEASYDGLRLARCEFFASATPPR